MMKGRTALTSQTLVQQYLKRWRRPPSLTTVKQKCLELQWIPQTRWAGHSRKICRRQIAWYLDNRQGNYCWYSKRPLAVLYLWPLGLQMNLRSSHFQCNISRPEYLSPQSSIFLKYHWSSAFTVTLFWRLPEGLTGIELKLLQEACVSSQFCFIKTSNIWMFI